jgi:hypothetical protein
MGRPPLIASVWELPMTTTITHAIVSVDVLEGLSRGTGHLARSGHLTDKLSFESLSVPQVTPAHSLKDVEAILDAHPRP